ncbi:MAG TPA: TetR/AcrR family transcriptional regulator [Streptosporangiaceae bacterium]|nr:TetR/AcrR family transcriptional regulator [Streptosporangiaceae bacterium]
MTRGRAAEPPIEFGTVWLRRDDGKAGKSAPLSRDQIVAAAIALADAEGLDAVSIRKIAASLGAGATSLYWHVRSKNDLFELMFDAVYGELEYPEPSGDWRADLRAICVGIRALGRRHRWVILLGVQPAMGPNVVRYRQFLADVLGPLGLDQRTRVEVAAVLNNYLMGSAHRDTAWDQIRVRAGLTGEQWRERLSEFLVRAERDNPELAADIATRLHLTSDDSFELGLDCVLDGVAARLIEPRS